MAARQHGVVARRQLLALGVTRAQIELRLRSGALIRVHPGVYRVGHAAPSVEADYMAAVIACGDGAYLSGLAAAWLHRLVKGKAPIPEVTAPKQRAIAGVRTRRARGLHPAHVARVKGIPVATVAEALADLAAIVSLDDLARSCHEAGVLHRTTPAQVEKALARRPNVRGARNLRIVIGREVQVTLSALERRFVKLLRENALPSPVTNRPAHGRRVDCRWPGHRLTVELDSYTFHHSRHAWEQDRRREREARARGDEFRRYTYGDVFEAPRLMLEELRALLRSDERAQR